MFKIFSNIDVATQLVSTIKQVLAMQAAIAFLEKNCTDENITKEDKALLLKNIVNIRKTLKMCKMVINRLKTKTKQVLY